MSDQMQRLSQHAKTIFIVLVVIATVGIMINLKKTSLFEPAHEIMVLFVLRKLILQTRMRGHPVGLAV